MNIRTAGAGVRRVAVVALGLVAACAGPRGMQGTETVAAIPSPEAVEAAVKVELPSQGPPDVQGYGPEILLPPANAADDEVARVGSLVVRKSHAFSRLLVADPKLAMSAVDLVVFDVLVAHHAQQYGITVDPAVVEERAVAEEKQLQRQVATELGRAVDFPSYVERMFAMSLADWRRTVRMRTAQRLYQGYVIRYLAMLEDRVQVRYLVHHDKAVADECYAKVRAGADFATLALRHSEDDYRRDGGLLPPFGRGFPHPVTKVAFTLQKGALSEPFQAKVGDELRWFVVFCLDRFDGRSVPFAEVRAQIDSDLEKRPLMPIETSSYALRWRGRIETDPAAEQKDR